MKYYKKNSKSKRRGGNSNLPTTVNYGSGENWMFKTVGSGNTQYNDTFSQKSPYPSTHGNALWAINGSGHHTGGKTRRKRRGGNLGQVINQAVVPFGLLGLQQTFRKRKGGKRKGGKSMRRY
jgi:hypothetical protein